MLCRSCAHYVETTVEKKKKPVKGKPASTEEVTSGFCRFMWIKVEGTVIKCGGCTPKVPRNLMEGR